MSTSSTADNEEVNSGEKWWHRFVRPFQQSIRKGDCGIQGAELSAECSVGAYFITKYGLKMPHVAFRNSMTTFLTVPLIYWPICRAREKNISFSEAFERFMEKIRKL